MEKSSVERKRPLPIRVMLSSAEKKMLSEAADQFGLALSVYVRVMALEASRRRETRAA